MYRIEEWKRDHAPVGAARIELRKGLWTVLLSDVWAMAETTGTDLEDCWQRAEHLHAIRHDAAVETATSIRAAVSAYDAERRALESASSVERAPHDSERDGRAAE
jgi:hypothetical protein